MSMSISILTFFQFTSGFHIPCHLIAHCLVNDLGKIRQIRYRSIIFLIKGRPNFFRRGWTRADFMFAGIVLLYSEAFTMLVIDGSTMSLWCLRRCIGNASKHT